MPGDVGRRAVPAGAGDDRPPGAGVHGVAVRRLADRASASSSPWAPGRCGPPTARRSCSTTSPAARSRRSPSACWRRASCPTTTVVDYLANGSDLPPDKLTLLVAPASSLAGTLQVVARSLETALHKLHELKFDLGRSCPASASPRCRRWPPTSCRPSAGPTTPSSTAAGSSSGCGPTTTQLAEIGPKVPSSASPDHGAPVRRDLRALRAATSTRSTRCCSARRRSSSTTSKTGRAHAFGRAEPEVLRRSFFGVSA